MDLDADQSGFVAEHSSDTLSRPSYRRRSRVARVDTLGRCRSPDEKASPPHPQRYLRPCNRPHTCGKLFPTAGDCSYTPRSALMISPCVTLATAEPPESR